MNIYFPASAASDFLPRLAAILPQGLLKPPCALKTLDLGRLRCFHLSTPGRLGNVRTPYVFPHLLEVVRYGHKPEDCALETLPGVDWVCLGGPVEGFAGMLARHLSACQSYALKTYTFASVSGRIAREPSPQDVRLELKISDENLNQAEWAEKMLSYLELPESQWSSAGGANIRDYYEIFRPHLTRLEGRSPRLILDLGCGLGQAARSLALTYPEARVVGGDASLEALSVARHHFQLPNLEYRELDVSAPLDFPDGSADIIVSSNALSYARNQAEAADEIFRVLSDQGIFLNSTRLEESNLYFDFPRTLILPTNHVSQLPDWTAAGARHGRECEAWPMFWGFGPQYFFAAKFKEFEDDCQDLAKTLDPAKQPYDFYQPHALLSFLPRGQKALPGRKAPELAHDYPSRLAQLLNSLLGTPTQAQGLSCLAWHICQAQFQTFPGSIDYYAGFLPEASQIIRAVLEI